MKIFKTALFTFSICFLCISNIFAANIDSSVGLYNKTLKTEINKLSNNFNQSNIENLFTTFLKYKGIDDPVIAYAVVELALENKDLLTSEMVENIKKFSPSQSIKIETMLSNHFFTKLFGITNYINVSSLFTIIKQVFGLFSILLFVYLLLKNFYLFTHSHMHNQKISFLAKIAAFTALFTTLLVIFPHNQTAAFSFMIPLLIFSEAKIGRYVCLLIIFIGIFLSSLDVNIANNTNKKHYVDAALKPISQKYLLTLQKKYPKDKLLQAIIYLKTDKSGSYLTLPEPKNSVEAVNFASVYLSQGKTDQFNKLIKQYNISNNPVILMNMNTFFMKNFMYDEYEQNIEDLYNHPSYYNIFQNYQLKFNKVTYFPYYEQIELITSEININWLNTLKYVVVFAIFLLIHSFLVSLKISRCKHCGKVHCAKCDNNFDDGTCSRCYDFYKGLMESDPTSITKKNIESENYKAFRTKFAFIISLILPGSGLIYTDNIIYGIIMTAIFAKVLYFTIFGFSAFKWPLNFGIQYTLVPAVTILIILFFIIYILSLVYLRKADVS